jgi:hypothetical protein
MRGHIETTVALGLLLVGPAAQARPGAESASDSNPLTVRIYDRAGVPPAALAAAEAAATRVLSSMGVDTSWAECPTGAEDDRCGAAAAPRQLMVIVLPHAPSQAGRSACVLGLSVLDHGEGTLAYIFYDRVLALSTESREACSSAVLGHVLAHEIGHLLLGANAHSTAGIMKAQWFTGDLHRIAQGGLLFTPGEGAHIRAALAVR